MCCFHLSAVMNDGGLACIRFPIRILTSLLWKEEEFPDFMEILWFGEGGVGELLTFSTAATPSCTFSSKVEGPGCVHTCLS